MVRIIARANSGSSGSNTLIGMIVCVEDWDARGVPAFNCSQPSTAACSIKTDHERLGRYVPSNTPPAEVVQVSPSSISRRVAKTARLLQAGLIRRQWLLERSMVRARQCVASVNQQLAPVVKAFTSQRAKRNDFQVRLHTKRVFHCGLD